MASAGLSQSTRCPSTRPPSTISKAKAWKRMIPVMCSPHVFPLASAGEWSPTAGIALQGAHHVFAGNDPHKPLIAIDDRHAADTMVDHQLKHPGQPGVHADIDVFRSHDIADRAPH